MGGGVDSDLRLPFELDAHKVSHKFSQGNFQKLGENISNPPIRKGSIPKRLTDCLFLGSPGEGKLRIIPESEVAKTQRILVTGIASRVKPASLKYLK